MDVVERLTLEAARDDSLLASEHRHRYEFATRLCTGQRVLDLCCGSGYGSAILAGTARTVTGIDNDAATIDLAQATVGRASPAVAFELADATEFLRQDIPSRFDVVVCFEGLEHLPDLDATLSRLQAHAERGLRIIASVPNSRQFGERNPYHLTDFGYDQAVAAFEGFPAAIMLPQFLAEGSLICPPDATGTAISLTVEDRNEVEAANHFIICVGFEAADVTCVYDGHMHLSAAPVFNRHVEGMGRGYQALQRENARLARGHLGRAGSAAAAALERAHRDEPALESITGTWKERCRQAESRIAELEAQLARATVAAAAGVRPSSPSVPSAPRPPVAVDAGSDRQPLPARNFDPNSWEERHRKAAEHLIPWIEQTVPLAGKTVLEYGCANAAVSCAFAARAARVIGVDIDARWIEEGAERLRGLGITNVELELHPLESIVEAVAARRGEIDVFLLYAVLEHLTLEERLAILRLAREVVPPDGAIVVCETPNRLIYFDHHTAQMPFFHLLPDELARQYFQHSPRADFRTAIAEASAQGPQAALEAIVRWGRGVSFHEFEVVFGDLREHVVASNYDTLLFAERPVQPDEMMLSRYLDTWRPDLAPVWSRYWLDLILSPQPIAKRAPFLRPWTMETLASPHVGWTSDSLELPSADARLWITLPHPTTRLVVGVVAAAGRVAVQARAEAMPAPLVVAADGAPGAPRYATFVLAEPAQRIAVGVGSPSRVVFVGYDD